MAHSPITFAGAILAEAPGQTPGWAVWLFEKPLTSALVALLAAGIVAVVLYRRGRVGASWIAAASGVVLAGALYATGSLVTTERERVIERARAFVDAVAASDTGAVSELLDERLVVTTRSRLVAGVGKEDVVALADTVGRYGLRSPFFRLDRAEASRSGLGTTEFGVQTNSDFGPSTSRWKLVWVRAPDGAWRISAIDCLSINGMDPGAGWTRGR